MSTPLLGLALPADGTTNWGTLANTSITALLDSAVAGTTTLTSDADATLTNTAEVANESRQAIILWKPLSGTATRTITAPAQSKTYVVINATGGTQSIIFRGSGSPPTTGVTVAASQAALLAWNGSDFALVASTDISKLTGTLGIANGGTGQTTQQAALNALVGTQTANRVLRSDGTNSTLSQVALATDVTGTLPIANGGTGLTTYTLNGVLFANSTTSLTTSTSLTYSDDRTMRLGAAGAAYTNLWNTGYKTFIIGGQTLAGVTNSSLSHLTSNLCDTTGAGVWNYAIGPGTARGSVLTQNNGVLTWSATPTPGAAATFASTTQRISADFNGNIQFNTAGAPGVFTNHGNASITGTLEVTGAITQNSVAVVTTTGTQTLSNKTLASNTVATTQAIGDSTTKVATTQFVQQALPGTAAGSIGSYVLATYSGPNTVNFGDTVVSSFPSAQYIKPVNLSATSVGTALNGTFVCMGQVVTYGNTFGPYSTAQIQDGSTLWLRVS